MERFKTDRNVAVPCSPLMQLIIDVGLCRKFKDALTKLKLRERSGPEVCVELRQRTDSRNVPAKWIPIDQTLVFSDATEA